MVFKRVIRHFAVLALMAGLFATTAESRQVSASTSKYGGTLKVALGDFFPGFCIGNNPGTTALSAYRSMYEPLMEKKEDGSFVGVLATSVTSTNDFKTWRINVRQGVTFHDNTVLDAEVVAKNLNWLRGAPYFENPFLPSLGTSTLEWSNVVNAEVEDASTVVVILEKPDALFQEMLWMGGRMFIRGSVQLGSNPNCANNPIGTGPFKIRSWDVDTLIVDRFPNYWRFDNEGNRLPYLDSITFSVIFERPVRSNAVRASAQDAGLFVASHENSDVVSLRENIQVVREAKSSRSFVTLLWLNQGLANTSLQSLKARQAVAAAVNVSAFQENKKDWDLTDPPSNPRYVSSLFSANRNMFDASRSRRLVSDYETENNKFLSVVLAHGIADYDFNAATSLVSSLSAVGINATRTVEERAQLIARTFDSAKNNQYQAIVFTVFSDSLSSLVPYLKSSVFEDSTNPFGDISQPFGSTLSISRHSNIEINRALDDVRASADTEVRQAKMQIAINKIAEEVLFVPLGSSYLSTFSSRYVYGIGSTSITPGEPRAKDSPAGVDYSTLYKSDVPLPIEMPTVVQPNDNSVASVPSTTVAPAVTATTTSTSAPVPAIASKAFALPTKSGKAVKISKPPVRTLSTKTLLAVSGKKVTVGLEVPKAKKKDAQVVRYVIELRTSTGVRVVSRNVKVKSGQRITPALNGKKKGSYVVVVTAVQKSGKKLTWTGPRVKVS